MPAEGDETRPSKETFADPWPDFGFDSRHKAGLHAMQNSVQNTFGTCRANLTTLSFIFLHNLQKLPVVGELVGGHRSSVTTYSTTSRASVDIRASNVAVSRYPLLCSVPCERQTLPTVSCAPSSPVRHLEAKLLCLGAGCGYQTSGPRSGVEPGGAASLFHHTRTVHARQGS